MLFSSGLNKFPSRRNQLDYSSNSTSLIEDWIFGGREEIVYGIALIHNKANNEAQVTAVRNLLNELFDADGNPYYRFKHIFSPHKVLIHHVIPSGVTVKNRDTLRGTATIYAGSYADQRYFNRAFSRLLDQGVFKLTVINDYTLLDGYDINNRLFRLKGPCLYLQKPWGWVISEDTYSIVGTLPENDTFNQAISTYQNMITTRGYTLEVAS